MKKRTYEEDMKKTATMIDIKLSDSRYPVIMKKQKYLDQNGKSSAATQFQDRPRVNKCSTTNIQCGVAD